MLYVQMLCSLQDAFDDLTQHLTSLETELQRFKSVNDLVVVDIQQNIDSTLASFHLWLSNSCTTLVVVYVPGIN